MAKAGRKKKEEEIPETLKEQTAPVLSEVVGSPDRTEISVIESPDSTEITVDESSNTIELTISTIEEVVDAEKIIEEKFIQLIEESKVKETMPEVTFFNQPVLSDQAYKWEQYIAMYKFTPESFLEKYPNHVNKRFIEEIISFRATKS